MLFGPHSPLRGPRFWITVASLAIVAAMATVDLDRTSPGPLSRVHGAALHAEGIAPNDCASCHGGWFESLAGACFDCHGGIEDDLGSGRGLHGVIAGDAEDCGRCHGEHNGPGFDLAGPRAYRLAGVLGEPWGPEASSSGEGEASAPGDKPRERLGERIVEQLASLGQKGVAGDTRGREAIDHARFGFALGGAHLELACNACHTAADADVLEPGVPRFRGLDANCASCHTDDHAPVFPSDCTTCHTQSDWAEPFWTPHAGFFPLEGAHASAECRDCHAAGTPTSLEAKLGRKGGGAPEVRDCAACHVVPHSEAWLAAGAAHPPDPAGPTMALGLAPASSASCAGCHDVTGPGFTGAAEALDPDVNAKVHASAGFALGAAHQELACNSCHAPRAGAGEPTERGLGTVLKSRADFEVPEAALAAFRAAHPGRARDDCAACHVDPHAGQFRGGLLGRGGASEVERTCVECHDANAFDQMTFEASDHAALDLALTGGHAELDCAACHGTTRVGADWKATLADAATRGDLRGAALVARAGLELGVTAPTGIGDSGTPGDLADPAKPVRVGPPAGAGPVPALEVGDLVRVFRGTDAECGTCHGAPHAGFVFGPEDSTDAAADCAACHSDQGFDLAAADFDHSTAVGFDLDGAHGQEDCGACHVPFAAPTAEGRTFGSIVARLVADGVLGGQGASAAEAHGVWEAHPALALNTGADTACALCHADVHDGVFAETFGRSLPGPEALGLGAAGEGEAPSAVTDCAACHTTASFRALPSAFDHTAATGFGLEGRHGELDCGACHVAAPTSELGRVPVAGDDCASCHAEPHGGQFADAPRGDDCARCHTTQDPFSRPRFNHNVDSDFPLDGRHAELSCTECHGVETIGGATTRRYWPLEDSCTSCHGEVTGSGILRRKTGGGGR